MRILKFLKSFQWSLSLLTGSVVTWNVASFFDHGNIDRIMAAGKPLLMDTPPEMLMVFVGAATALGVITLVAEFSEACSVPVVGDGFSGLVAFIQEDARCN